VYLKTESLRGIESVCADSHLDLHRIENVLPTLGLPIGARKHCCRKSFGGTPGSAERLLFIQLVYDTCFNLRLLFENSVLCFHFSGRQVLLNL
jgi:hypothetical protein